MCYFVDSYKKVFKYENKISNVVSRLNSIDNIIKSIVKKLVFLSLLFLLLFENNDIYFTIILRLIDYQKNSPFKPKFL